MEQPLFVDPFKLAEFFGYSRGFIVQGVVTLDADESFSFTLIPPEDVVWWWTLCGLGDVPASSVLSEWSLRGELQSGIYKLQRGTILFDEAWVAQQICPPGWRRFDYEITCKITNVTGHPEYNTLVAQIIQVHFTAFFIEVDKKFVQWVEEKYKVVM